MSVYLIEAVLLEGYTEASAGLPQGVLRDSHPIGGGASPLSAPPTSGGITPHPPALGDVYQGWRRLGLFLAGHSWGGVNTS